MTVDELINELVKYKGSLPVTCVVHDYNLVNARVDVVTEHTLELGSEIDTDVVDSDMYVVISPQ